MQKRIENTINKLYIGLKNVSKNKLYDDIIIQDILDEADISRSTFYKYFKTKDDLILYIFNRVFKNTFMPISDDLKAYISKEDYIKAIYNIFVFVYGNNIIFSSIFNSKSNSKLFVEVNLLLKPYIKYGLEHRYFKVSVLPDDLYIKHLLNDFTFFTFIWVKENFSTNYKTMASYYIEMNIS